MGANGVLATGGLLGNLEACSGDFGDLCLPKLPATLNLVLAGLIIYRPRARRGYPPQPAPARFSIQWF
jgi:hypothetical protein